MSRKRVMRYVSSKGFPADRIVCLVCLMLLAAFASVAAPAQQNRAPIQAALLKPMEAGRMTVGNPVFVKVESEWKSPDCNLRKGAMIKGRVVAQSVRSKTQKTSEVALLFDSGECSGRDMKPLPLTVVAVLAPDPNLNTNLFADREGQPLSEAVGLAIGGGGGGPALGGTSGGNLRSLTGAALTAYTVEPPKFKPPKAVLPGQVIGIGDLKLLVGGGPEDSCILSSTKHNVRLEAGSQLVLVLKAKTDKIGPVVNTAVPPSSLPATSASVEVKPTDRDDAPDETEVCSPPACSVALGAGEIDPGTIHEAAALSVQQLGFRPPADLEMYGFAHDAAIAYLGPTELLFTFNPHVLVSRSSAEVTAPKLHMIRAVLLNLKTMKVEQTLDWHIQDAQQYLWTIGQDSVLVHVGRELRIYGPGLKLKQKLVLSGALAFVRISPSASYFAVGTVHERHSEVTHRQLAETEDREPEEDVELKVLDAEFRTLVTVTRSSREVPPVLSDDGEIRIPTTGKNRWRIVELTWTGQRHVLAQVHSTCRPEATSLPPDLLFVVGCDRQADSEWYRMLRPDGKPVLKGSSSSEELEQSATGIAQSGAFTVGVAESAKSRNRSAPFRASDLKDQRIGVYRVENGQKLITIRIPSPLPMLQTFALSPNGRQLAVLDRERILFYALPGTSAH